MAAMEVYTDDLDALAEMIAAAMSIADTEYITNAAFGRYSPEVAPGGFYWSLSITHLVGNVPHANDHHADANERRRRIAWCKDAYRDWRQRDASRGAETQEGA